MMKESPISQTVLVVYFYYELSISSSRSVEWVIRQVEINRPVYCRPLTQSAEYRHKVSLPPFYRVISSHFHKHHSFHFLCNQSGDERIGVAPITNQILNYWQHRQSIQSAQLLRLKTINKVKFSKLIVDFVVYRWLHLLKRNIKLLRKTGLHLHKFIHHRFFCWCAARPASLRYWLLDIVNRVSDHL